MLTERKPPPRRLTSTDSDPEYESAHPYRAKNHITVFKKTFRLMFSWLIFCFIVRHEINTILSSTDVATQFTWSQFLPRDAKRGLCCRAVSVRPSVCPSVRVFCRNE